MPEKKRVTVDQVEDDVKQRPGKRRSLPKPKPKQETPVQPRLEPLFKSEPAPDYRVVIGLEKSRLPWIAERLASICEHIRLLNLERVDLQQEGAGILLKAKVKTVMVDDLRVTQTAGTNKHIKRDLLLKYGVKLQVIEKATVGTPWTSLKVTKKKEQGEGEEGDDE